MSREKKVELRFHGCYTSLTTRCQLKPTGDVRWHRVYRMSLILTIKLMSETMSGLVHFRTSRERENALTLTLNLTLGC